MSVRPTGEAGGRTASRLLASFPWVVVFLGVALLTTLLLVALLSFRGPERQALPSAPAPSVLLPTPLAAATPAGPPPTSATPRPTRSRAATPTRPAPSRSARPDSGASATASAQPLVSGAETGDPAGGDVTARYAVTDSDTGSFRAELLLVNAADRRREWRVDLQFTSDVHGVRVYSDSSISVWGDGHGRYVLSGDLRGGEQEWFSLRFRRDGGGDEPIRCTVNGAECVIR
ncbi:hypothetical protein [Micromonospora sp. NPDC126480]|uniref:hypothetical protein n=1 Tax=Micromonospora sp. NPDC126480 TaxID=3155312 RepID=UPI003321CB66